MRIRAVIDSTLPRQHATPVVTLDAWHGAALAVHHALRVKQMYTTPALTLWPCPGCCRPYMYFRSPSQSLAHDCNPDDLGGNAACLDPRIAPIPAAAPGARPPARPLAAAAAQASPVGDDGQA